jgi:hypothetical protein
MRKKYSKLRKILKAAQINTLPGVVMVSTNQHELLQELLTEVATEQDAN